MKNIYDFPSILKAVLDLRRFGRDINFVRAECIANSIKIPRPHSNVN